ncbi:hypothetical protein U9M48_003349 [Paspalum notatum var. saurae]|uniref:Uncharacterized protein n=1 Tax=Paspalum notatum var. saurae TaxID=547442 RepID=A0AAQ3PQX4_PASNO
MLEEFNEVFEAIGWSDFAKILEGGIILLTKEFLMMLRTDTRRDARALARTRKKQYIRSHDSHPTTPSRGANPQGQRGCTTARSRTCMGSSKHTCSGSQPTGFRHSSWNSIVPSVNPTPSHHRGGYGHGAGPSHSACYTGGELDGNFTALFGALDLQEHRTLGMMDSIADIQQQQGVDHNLILETRATVDRMQE